VGDEIDFLNEQPVPKRARAPAAEKNCGRFLAVAGKQMTAQDRVLSDTTMQRCRLDEQKGKTLSMSRSLKARLGTARSFSIPRAIAALARFSSARRSS